MKFRPNNTLAYFNAAPQVRLHDLSSTPVAVFSESTLKYRQNCGLSSPEGNAVSFYTLNHCASIIRQSFTENEPLPQWAKDIMETYTGITMEQGERMLHYILSIVTREMRHLKESHSQTFWKGMEKQAGPEMVTFIKALHNHGDAEDSGAVAQYMKHPPTATVGQYLQAMAYGFWKGWGDYNAETWQQKWKGGYGGPSWATVAEAALSMVRGQTSMEMLVDTGYTLAHNGGPIFNKGMMYQGQNNTPFLTILDVQRAGYMLDLMLDPIKHFHIEKTPVAVKAAELIKQHLPQELKGYIDWKLVNELRPQKDKDASPLKYSKLTSVQKQATKKPSVTAAAKSAAPQPLATTLVGGKKAKAVGTFEVFPHQSVTVLVREQ